jgi:serine/threonine protein kinase/Flp pilus assembly protein TadD
VIRATEEYWALLEAGQRPDRRVFLARYPEIEAALAQCLEGLDLVQSAVPRLYRPGVASEPPSGFGLPTALGDYRILREVGRGGMGIVYEAEQVSLGRRVALKVLPFAAAVDAKLLQRFKNEAQAAAQLHHTNIVPVYAVGCEQGIHYYAMQFIEGQTVATLIRELRQGNDECRRTNDERSTNDEVRSLDPDGRGPAEETRLRHSTLDILSSFDIRHSSLPHRKAFFRTVAQLGVQAAEALDHAHEQGVIHRDVKPANLLLDVRGHLWVTDFGLARMRREANLTLTGDLLGTLRYMSPEQARGSRAAVDQRSDLYSLGATLYELLTLRPVCDGRDREEVLRQVDLEEPCAPRRLNRAVPAELEIIVLKALAKNPAERYATAQDLADDLRCFLADKPIQARRPTLGQRLIRWGRRHKSVVSAAAVVLVLTLLGLAVGNVVLTAAYRRETAQRALAEVNQKLAEERGQVARDAVDHMYTQFAEQWLREQPGLEQVERVFLEKALAFYEKLSQETGSQPDVRYQTALAYQRVGAIQRRLGACAEAEAAYGRAVTLFEELAAGDAAEPKYRVGLAESRQALGQGQLQMGRAREAEASLRQALDLKETLVQEFPQKVAYRRGLAGCYNSLGRLYERTGPAAAAVQYFRHALEVSEKLVDESPTEASCRQSLADDLTNLGRLFLNLGRFAEAEKYFREGLRHHEKLAADFPAKAVYRQGLASARRCLGNLLLAGGRTADAEEAFRQALGLQQKLVADFPTVPAYRHNEALYLHNLGLALERLGRAAEAEQAYRQSQALGEKLVADFPAVPDYQNILATTLHNLGVLVRNQGNPAAARPLLEQAVRYQEAARKANPDNLIYRTNLSSHYRSLAETLLRLGEPAAAAETAGQLPRSLPEDWASYQLAATLLARCAPADEEGTLLSAGSRAAAQTYTRRQQEVLEEGLRRHPDHPQALGQLAWFLTTCPDAAFRDPPRAVELAQKAVARTPASAAAWNLLGLASHRAGDAKAALAALERAVELRKGGNGYDLFGLALAHGQLGNQEQARRWYDQAVQWMDQKKAQATPLRRLRAEAAALLGIPSRPPAPHLTAGK